MGYRTQEFPSGPLSSLYRSYYKEFQIKNLTHVRIVITDAFGNQEPMDPDTTVQEREAQVQVEWRFNNGPRTETTKYGTREIQLPTKRISIPFIDLLSHPIRLTEHHLIISTDEQSDVAKEMVRNDLYNPRLFETRVDNELTDPRFVFQVRDPGNQLDVLFVNVFGATVILRAGAFGEIIPTCYSSQTEQVPKPTLVCYLRYPTDYCDAAKSSSTIFEVDLDNLDEPIRLPSGDVMCVATSIDDLKKVLAKKAGGTYTTVTGPLATKMVSKDLYEATLASHKSEIDRLKSEAKTKLETIVIEKDNEIAKLTADRDKERRDKEAAEKRASEWESIHQANSKVRADQQDFETKREKTRKEAQEAYNKEVDRMYAMLKIGGTITAAVLSFALTTLLKTKK